VKILGWILAIIGSNGITGALVARQSFRYDMGNLADSIVERVVEILGAEQGVLNTLVVLLTDNLADGLVEMLGTDHEFVRMIDMLLYISIGVLALGIVLLVIGHIRGAKVKMQSQLVQQATHQVVSDQAMCLNCSAPVSGKFCPSCGQKVG